jgi:hypothetical protein
MEHLILEFGWHVMGQATMQGAHSSGNTKYKHQWKWLDVTTANRTPHANRLSSNIHFRWHVLLRITAMTAANEPGHLSIRLKYMFSFIPTTLVNVYYIL